MSQFSSFRLSFRSVGRPFLPSPGWSAFSYAGRDICGENIGWITSRTQWVELFQLLTAATKLYLSGELVQCIALTLRGLVEEGTTEVLPALQNLFLHSYRPSGPVGQAIGEFALRTSYICWFLIRIVGLAVFLVERPQPPIPFTLGVVYLSLCCTSLHSFESWNIGFGFS